MDAQLSPKPCPQDKVNTHSSGAFWAPVLQKISTNARKYTPQSFHRRPSFCACLHLLIIRFTITVDFPSEHVSTVDCTELVNHICLLSESANRIENDLRMHYAAIGIAYIACEWTLFLVEFLAVVLRLHSRTFLTRSVESDDFFILIALVRTRWSFHLHHRQIINADS